MTLAPHSRREEGLRRFAELAETARAWVESNAPGAVADPRVAALVQSVEAAETQARLGDVIAAVRTLEPLLPGLLEDAGRSGIDLDAARPRARALVERTLTSAILAEAYRVARDAAGSERFRSALDAFADGERALSRRDHSRAAASFRRATVLLEAVLSDQTLAAVEERLRALRRRRGRLVDELRRLPTRAFPERQRESAIDTMRRLDRALENGDEERAKNLLADCEALLHDPTADTMAAAARPAARENRPPKEPRGFSWGLAAAFIVGLVAIAVGLGIIEPDARAPFEWLTATESVPPVADDGAAAPDPEPGDAAAGPGAAGVEPVPPPRPKILRASAVAPPARPRPDLEARLARIREASAAHAGTSRADPGGFPEVHGFSPPDLTITLAGGERRRFEVSIADAPERLRWELDGAVVGRGPGVEVAALLPGTHWLALVDEAGASRRLLRAWELRVVPAGSTKDGVPQARPATEEENEILVWIDAWCSAFERKDVDTLAALGEIRGADDAAMILRTLAPMIALQVSCVAPEIAIEGDEAILRFVRTDRWSDPSAARFEKVHPPVDRRLRRHDGRWVVASEDEPKALHGNPHR